MEKDSTEYKISVMQACRVGKHIQVRRKDNPDRTWAWAPFPHWDWVTYDYRIKPEPRVIYVNEYDNPPHTYGVHPTADRAIRCAGGIATRTAVKYVEATDE